MRYPLSFSPQAREDLLRVWDEVYAVSLDGDTADRYTKDLLQELRLMAEYPKAGLPLYVNDLFTGLYSVNFKAYKSFYRLQESRLEVLRILPARSDYLKILFPEEE